LQTRNRQYPPTAESTPTSTEANPTPTGPPLVIPCPSAEPPLRIPRIPLRRNVHNPQARAAHNYSLVDDLAQSPAAMSVLEVLQTCPTQRKSLLSAMGAVDPADTRLITFDLDKCETTSSRNSRYSDPRQNTEYHCPPVYHRRRGIHMHYVKVRMAETGFPITLTLCHHITSL
jgi:hypothetical protein